MLAEKLLRLEFPNVINSAHLYALTIFSKTELPPDFPKTLHALKTRNFPKDVGERYTERLIKGVLALGMGLKRTDDEMILEIFCSVPAVYYRKYAEMLSANAKKLSKRWVTLIEYTHELRNDKIESYLINALISAKHSEKSLNELTDLLPKELRDYFWSIANDALKTLNPKKAAKNAEIKTKQQAKQQPSQVGGYTYAAGGKGETEKRVKVTAEETDQESKKKGFFGLFGGNKKK